MRPFVLFTVLAAWALSGCGPEGASSTILEPPIAVARHNSDQAPEPGRDSTFAESEPMKVLEEEFPLTRPGETPVSDLKPGTDAKGPALPSVKLVSGNPYLKRIALTIDDGPHRGFTDQLLRILKELNVKATFFMIGRNVDEWPELARLSHEEGFEIANHTYSHARLATLSEEAIRDELVKGADAVERATGVRPTYFRPPGGEYDDRVIKIVRELGMTMVLWTADAGDYTTVTGNPSEDAIKAKVLRYIKPGAIVIMHDPMPESLRALPSIVTTLRAMGYEFVTVSELAADPMAVRIGGPRIKPNAKATVQALVNEARYPLPKSTEDKNANSEQGTSGATPPKGKEGQGTDQRGQSGGQGKQGHQIKPQTREGR